MGNQGTESDETNEFRYWKTVVGAYSAVALGGLGLVGAWLKVAPDSRSSVKVAKSLTR